MQSKNIGRNIKRYIKKNTKKGMSQVKLAKKAKITQAALSQVIHGVREPSIGTTIRLIKATGLSFEELTK